jgi:hypothetical protein
VSSFLKGSERLSLRNIYSVAINNIQGGGRSKRHDENFDLFVSFLNPSQLLFNNEDMFPPRGSLKVESEAILL